MSWTNRINLALEYIEANLDGVINLDDVARAAHCSKYHFHRTFFAIFNIPCGQYIKQRKLSLAALDVTARKARIADIALKYGYDSPNAFTRAFRSIHGINPSDARNGSAKITYYERLSFSTDKFSNSANIKGGNKVEFRILSKPQLTIVGKSKTFDFDTFVKTGPKFWKEYVGTQSYKDLMNISKGLPGAETSATLLSAYFPREDGDREEFTDVLGIEINSEYEANDFETLIVPAATYAEFQCTYRTSMKTNRYIYREWFAASGYERDGNKPDIVGYFPIPFRPMNEMLLRWWIPVTVK